MAVSLALLTIVAGTGSPTAEANSRSAVRDQPETTASTAATPALASASDPVQDASLVGPGIGWVVTQRAVKRTSNDGRMWTTVTPAGLPAHLVGNTQPGGTNVFGLDAFDARHALIATEVIGRDEFTMTIWRTADGGATWRQAILRHLEQTGHDQCPVCGGGGVTFHVLSASDAFMEYGYVRGVDEQIHPIYQTSDGGATWRRIGTADTSLAFLLAFRTTRTILFSDGRSVSSTTSGWDHLTAAPLGDRLEVGDVQASAFFSARSWIMGIRSDGSDFEFAVTADNGKSWRFGLRAPPKPLAGQVQTDIEPVAFLDPTMWLAAAETCTAAQVCRERLFRTRDRGHTWQRLGQLPVGVLASGITFVDHFHGWAEVYGDGGQTSSALYATDNGGWSWRTLTP